MDFTWDGTAEYGSVYLSRERDVKVTPPEQSPDVVRIKMNVNVDVYVMWEGNEFQWPPKEAYGCVRTEIYPYTHVAMHPEIGVNRHIWVPRSLAKFLVDHAYATEVAQ